MALQKKLKTYGLTPVKALLIVVLIVAMAGVLYHQFGGLRQTSNGNPQSTRTPPAKKPSSKRTVPRPGAVDDDDSDGDPTIEWPEIALDEVINHDPFAVPQDLVNRLGLQEAEPEVAVADVAPPDLERERQRERNRIAISELRRIGVGLIFLTDEVDAVLIGEQELRKGDVVSGFRVTDIGPEGVLLEEL